MKIDYNQNNAETIYDNKVEDKRQKSGTEETGGNGK